MRALQLLARQVPALRALRCSAASAVPDVSCREAANTLASTSYASLSPSRWMTAQVDDKKHQWQFLVKKGAKVNPCNSPLHPAVEAGIQPEGTDVIPVQVAYTPDSRCFGCGPAHPDGLHLQSRRILNGLEASVRIPSKYCAFPGILNGGIISTVLDCHGNWTAAIALMDKACLPKPPLTLTASILVSYKEPTPPDTDLILRSQVVNIKETTHPGLGKPTVEVDVTVFQKEDDGQEKVLVHATVICKRLGALRAL